MTGNGAKLLEQARASSALTAFVIPLALSLVALLPEAKLGLPAVVVSFGGLLFVAATIRRYFSVQRADRENPRGLIGLLGFTAVMAIILASGILSLVDPISIDPAADIAIATVALILLGIDRAWALIGGRGRGRGTALRDLMTGEPPRPHDNDQK